MERTTFYLLKLFIAAALLADLRPSFEQEWCYPLHVRKKNKIPPLF